jgi:hypothetical protein
MGTYIPVVHTPVQGELSYLKSTYLGTWSAGPLYDLRHSSLHFSTLQRVFILASSERGHDMCWAYT